MVATAMRSDGAWNAPSSSQSQAPAPMIPAPATMSEIPVRVISGASRLARASMWLTRRVARTASGSSASGGGGIGCSSWGAAAPGTSSAGAPAGRELPGPDPGAAVGASAVASSPLVTSSRAPVAGVSSATVLCVVSPSGAPVSVCALPWLAIPSARRPRSPAWMRALIPSRLGSARRCPR